jgi:hypothetical protein
MILLDRRYYEKEMVEVGCGRDDSDEHVRNDCVT